MFRLFVRNYTSNIKYYEGISKVNNYRENRSYGKSVRVKSIKKFYELTREIPEHNIDSHDNSLYVKEPTNLTFSRQPCCHSTRFDDQNSFQLNYCYVLI